MAARASTYKVPDWAVKNKEIFLSAARGVAPPARKERAELRMSSADLRDAQLLAAMSMSVLSEEREGGIKPPSGNPGADYFRDVANHPDVLSTIISTARAAVGFIPNVNGKGLTDEQLEKYIEKFNEFLDELNLYYAYIHLIGSPTPQTFQGNSINCEAIMNTITIVLAEALGVDSSPSGFIALEEAASSVIKIAVDYILSESYGKATIANFEMVGLPKSNVAGEEAYRDPISAVTFNTTSLSRQKSGKTTLESTTLTISANPYQLDSSAVIEYADQLAAGYTTIIGNSALRDYINSVLLSTN